MGKAAKRRTTAVAPVKMPKARPARAQPEAVFAEDCAVAVPTEVPTQAVPPTQELEMQPPAQMSTYTKKRRSFMELVELGMQLRHQRMQEGATEELPSAHPVENSAHKRALPAPAAGSLAPEADVPCGQIDPSEDEQPTQRLEEADFARTARAGAEDVPGLHAPLKEVTTTPQPKRVCLDADNIDTKLSVAPEVKRRRLSGKQRSFAADILYKHGVSIDGCVFTATACPGQSAMPTIVFGTPCSSNDFNWQLRVLQKQGDIRIGMVDLPRYKTSVDHTGLNGLSWQTEECSRNVAIHLACQDKGIVLFNGKRQQGTRNVKLADGDLLTVKRHGSAVYIDVNGSEVAHVPASSMSSFFALQFCATSDSVEIINAPTGQLPAPVENQMEGPEGSVPAQDGPKDLLAVMDAEVQVTQSLRSPPKPTVVEEECQAVTAPELPRAEVPKAVTTLQPAEVVAGAVHGDTNAGSRSSHAIGAGQSLHGTEFSMPAAAAAGTPNGLTSAFQLPGVTAESMKVVSTSVAEHLRASERAVRVLVQRHQQVADVLQALQGIVNV
mmetsp:Transcript_15540/g.35580  ORF Transcript_15540/g.35580 Transcript_15540/m.35580 type:complete len:553 (+) Transcript_15540:60-1718(+)